MTLGANPSAVYGGRVDGSRQGKLWAVGLGPGDSELVTFKAAKAIGAADVVAYHCADMVAASRSGSRSPTCATARSTND